MKKSLILVLSLVLLIGCGQKEAKETPQGQSQANKYITVGMKYLQEGDIRRAIQSFDQAIKDDPSNPENYIVLGQVYMRLKNFQGAVDSLTAATKIDPRNGEAFYLLATSRILRASKEDNVKAIEAAQKSVEIFMKDRDEKKFKRSLALLQSITDKIKSSSDTAAAESAISIMEQMKKEVNAAAGQAQE